ncbi:MAG: ERF family protein [Colwellia sp.]|nr:ERF family protein [Colwellia sp.]
MNKKTEIITKDETIHPLAVQQEQYMGLIQMAVEKGADIAQLEKLMDLQDRFEAKNARRSFFEGLSIFQSIIPTIKKTGLASFKTKTGKTEYTYAKLEDIARVIRPTLKEAGLSYRYEQSSENNLMTVICIITHKEGHQEQTSMSAFADQSGSKNQIQQIASTISYLRRYTLTGALGITVGDEDDDGGFYEEQVEQEDQINEDDFCSEELFNQSFPAGEAKILSKEKTAEQIIKFFEKKVKLTDQQKEIINNVGKA